jgi:general secretion pathway protein A
MSDPTRAAFDLHRDPFGKDIALDSLWLDQARQDGLDTILDTVTARKNLLITGEVGVGKTSVLRLLRSGLSPVHFRVVYLSHVTLGPRDFYRQLALVLDECQLMPDRTLAHLHVLCNFDWDSQPLMSLVLVGLPELHDRLRLGVHRSLLTRLAAKVELQPITPEQTTAYVRHRVAEAGAKGELFAPDALAMIHELSGGVLRCIDVLASASLRLAATRDIKLVDRDLVARAYHATPLA